MIDTKYIKNKLVKSIELEVNENLLSLFSFFDDKIDKLDLEVFSLEEKISNLKKDIVLLENIKNDLIKNEAKNLSILKEIENNNKSLNFIKKEIDSNNITLNKIKIESENIISSKDKKLKELEIKNTKSSNFILPKLSEIQKREDAVAKRENDVKVIEQRFIRLYQEKGVPLNLR